MIERELAQYGALGIIVIVMISGYGLIARWFTGFLNGLLGSWSEERRAWQQILAEHTAVSKEMYRQMQEHDHQQQEVHRELLEGLRRLNGR